MGVPDSRVGGRIFATLASQSQGYGNSMLPLEQQGRLRARIARGFPTDSGCWGKNGNDPHSPTASERGGTGWRSAHGMAAQDRKDYKHEG